jgi:hypothetical protein
MEQISIIRERVVNASWIVLLVIIGAVFIAWTVSAFMGECPVWLIKIAKYTACVGKCTTRLFLSGRR